MAKPTKHSSISLKLDLKNPKSKVYLTPNEETNQVKVYYYTEGDTIKGDLIVDVKQAQPVDMVKIKFIGVLWHKRRPRDEDLNQVIALNYSHRRSKVTCFYEQNLLDATKIVQYREKYGAKCPYAANGDMTAKKHVLPFEYKLAHRKEGQILPPTYEDSNTKICYMFYINIQRGEARSCHLLQIVKLLPFVDIIKNPEIKAEFIESRTIDQKSLLGAGFYMIKCQIPKMGYGEGEAIPIELFMTNKGNKAIEGVIVRLVRHVMYNGLDEKSAAYEEVVLLKTALMDVQPGSTMVRQTVTLTMEKSPQVYSSVNKVKKKRVNDEESSESDSDDEEPSAPPSADAFGASLYTQIDVPGILSIDHCLEINVFIGKIPKEDVKNVKKKGFGATMKRAAKAISTGQVIKFDVPLFTWNYAPPDESAKARAHSDDDEVDATNDMMSHVKKVVDDDKSSSAKSAADESKPTRSQVPHQESRSVASDSVQRPQSPRPVVNPNIDGSSASGATHETLEPLLRRPERRLSTVLPSAPSLQQALSRRSTMTSVQQCTPENGSVAYNPHQNQLQQENQNSSENYEQAPPPPYSVLGFSNGLQNFQQNNSNQYSNQNMPQNVPQVSVSFQGAQSYLTPAQNSPLVRRASEAYNKSPNGLGYPQDSTGGNYSVASKSYPNNSSMMAASQSYNNNPGMMAATLLGLQNPFMEGKNAPERRNLNNELSAQLTRRMSHAQVAAPMPQAYQPLKGDKLPDIMMELSNFKGP